MSLLCVFSFMTSSVQAAPPTDINSAVAAVQADSVLISGWVSDQFKRAIPFNSTSGDVVPSQLKIFGFEAGVEGVVSGTKLDANAFHNLGTSVIDTTQISIFDRLPVPMVLGHAKIGLPFGLDAGIRIGGIPSTSSDKGSTHVDVSNSVVGLDVRKKLIDEGITRPFGLTLGVNFTRAKGHINASTPYNPNLGSNVTFTNAVGTGRTDWDTKSVGAQLVLNKQILFLNPYIGAAVNKNFGSINTTITNTGSASFGGGPSQAYNSVGSASATPNSVDLRGLAGLELSFLPFMKLDIGGEIASQNQLAGSIGLRIQFR
jgi:hypothetical protein